MNASFVELPSFERYRGSYLNEESFRQLQLEMLANPECGAVIAGTGGLRKMRFADARRGKGKRSGLRVIYFWWSEKSQLWLFTIYDKDEMQDLTAGDKKLLKRLLQAELEAQQ